MNERHSNNNQTYRSRLCLLENFLPLFRRIHCLCPSSRLLASASAPQGVRFSQPRVSRKFSFPVTLLTLLIPANSCKAEKCVCLNRMSDRIQGNLPFYLIARPLFIIFPWRQKKGIGQMFYVRRKRKKEKGQGLWECTRVAKGGSGLDWGTLARILLGTGILHSDITEFPFPM